MITCTTKSDIQKTLVALKTEGKRIGFVPTMGALHEGHLSLVDLAREHADIIVASIFVNPLQFGPNEDFDTYPRQMENDANLLEARGCTVLFSPERASLFPENFSTEVKVTQITENHCGASRPAFFGGIATIVTKLLMILKPDIAIFGEKDYQQLTMIQRLVCDLDIDTEILGGPTVREHDGLAMSSRNQYLTPQERTVAPLLFQTLTDLAHKISKTPERWPSLQAETIETLLKGGIDEIDYIDAVNADTLELYTDNIKTPARLLAAVRLGKTRLIDNIAVG